MFHPYFISIIFLFHPYLISSGSGEDQSSIDSGYEGAKNMERKHAWSGRRINRNA
jgi:hypothetical protein